MNDSLSLSLSLLQYLKKKNQKPLYQALQKIKEGHQYSPLSFSLYYMHIYIYTHTHTYRVGYILGVPDHIILWCE